MVVCGHRHAPAALLLWKRSGTLCTEVWGPQGRSRWVQKLSPPPGFELQTVRPVASRYTNYTVPAYLVGRVAYTMPIHVVLLSINFFHLHNFSYHFWFITLLFSSRFLNFDALTPSLHVLGSLRLHLMHLWYRTTFNDFFLPVLFERSFNSISFRCWVLLILMLWNLLLKTSHLN